MSTFFVRVCLIWSIVGLGQVAMAVEEPLTIYIDADYSITPAPAQAIEIGLRSAFAGTWAEDGIRIISKDHRKNARRSLDTFQDAVRDPTAIAIFGGMDSPPYFANHNEINRGGLPLLLSWSAGGRLTRFAEGADNWIFRLSVDDTKAARKLTRFASQKGCAVSSLVVLDNPWGNGNAKRIAQYINIGHGAVSSVHALPVDTGVQQVAKAVYAIQAENADCVLMVTSLGMGAQVINALADLPNPPRVISHWGLLGSRVTDHISPEVIDRVNLRILGTCGLRFRHIRRSLHQASRRVAAQISNGNFDPELHPAPHGYFHAHDLGLLLLQALKVARNSEEWRADPVTRRRAVRDAMYQLNTPVEGLLKTYVSPFQPVSPENFDGHEALGAADLCMTSINENGQIVDVTGDLN